MINPEVLIIIIYLMVTVASFYPIMYQLAIIERVKDPHEHSVRGNNLTANGRVFLVVPVKSEPLDLVESSMRRLAGLQGVSTIYVLDDYDDNAIGAIRALGNGYGIRVIHREKPRGYKGGALNHVIKRVGMSDDDVMLVLDVDSVVSQETINELISRINSADAVVPHWIASNGNDSSLARGQWVGYLLFFRVLRALSSLVGWVPILGSGSLVRVGALRRVGYWPEDVLEDVELGVRFFINGLKVEYVDHAFINVEVPVNYSGFLRQQLRWSFGVGRVIRRYFWQVIRRRHGMAVMLYLGQYFAYVLQLASILMLALIDVGGLAIPPWAFIALLITIVPPLATYLYTLLMIDKEYGGDPRKDAFAINSVNLAFIMALPRIAIANLMGLLNIGSIEWVPTPKGSRKWAKEGINLLPEHLMTALVITAFAASLIHMHIINVLITAPYLAGYARGLWRILNKTL